MLTEAGKKDAATVLVVDDEPDFLFKIVELLKEDLRVLATDDVDAALHLLESRSIAMVLTDIRRARSRGAQLLRRATGLSASTVRLLLTGGGDVDFVQATRGDQVYLYFSRHWSSRKLSQRVREALEIRDRDLASASPDGPVSPSRLPEETPAPVADMKAPDRHASDLLPEILVEYRRVLGALKESEARCRELEDKLAGPRPGEAGSSPSADRGRLPEEAALEPRPGGRAAVPKLPENPSDRLVALTRQQGLLLEKMSRQIRSPLERLRVSSDRLLSSGLNGSERRLAKEIRTATVDLLGQLDRWLGSADRRSETDHAELSAFDPKFLDNFRRMEEARGDAVFVPMARTFLGKAPVYLEMIRQALAEGHLQPLAKAAHSLTGVAGTLGALRLSDASRELERRARGGVLEGCGDQLRVVESEYELAESQIHGLVAGA